MRCAEIMKKDVHVVLEDDTVLDAARKLRDHNIGFLPVCDAGRRALGTITDRDIAVRLVAEDRKASECLVRDAMTREVVACKADDDVGEAERLMGQYQKSRILVTDVHGVIAGVISLSDIAERESLRRVGATMREVAAREARL